MSDADRRKKAIGGLTSSALPTPDDNPKDESASPATPPSAAGLASAADLSGGVELAAREYWASRSLVGGYPSRADTGSLFALPVIPAATKPSIPVVSPGPENGAVPSGDTEAGRNPSAGVLQGTALVRQSKRAAEANSQLSGLSTARAFPPEQNLTSPGGGSGLAAAAASFASAYNVWSGLSPTTSVGQSGESTMVDAGGAPTSDAGLAPSIVASIQSPAVAGGVGPGNLGTEYDSTAARPPAYSPPRRETSRSISNLIRQRKALPRLSVPDSSRPRPCWRER